MITARLYDNHRKYSSRHDFLKKLEEKTDTEIDFPSVPARVQAECIHVDDFNPHPLSIPTQLPGQQQLSSDGLIYNSKYIQQKQKQKQGDSVKNLENLFKKYKRLSYFTSTYEEYFLYSRPSQGILPKQIEDLKQWVLAHKDTYRIVFFDWDDTFTVMKGFFSVYHLSDVHDFVCEYAEYIVGGKEQLERLLDMFKFLTKNNVLVYILTTINFETLSPDDQLTFTRIIQCVYPQFQPDQFIVVQDGTNNREALYDSSLWKRAPLNEEMTNIVRQKQQENQRTRTILSFLSLVLLLI